MKKLLELFKELTPKILVFLILQLLRCRKSLTSNLSMSIPILLNEAQCSKLINSLSKYMDFIGYSEARSLDLFRKTVVKYKNKNISKNILRISEAYF